MPTCCGRHMGGYRQEAGLTVIVDLDFPVTPAKPTLGRAL